MFKLSGLVKRAVIPDGWICPSCLRHNLTASRQSFSGTARAQRTPRRTTPVTRPHAIGSDDVGVRTFRSTASEKAAPKRKVVLPAQPARTRFAPSPTGYLHIGGLRTALFSYLLAKRTGGQFLLRIEDTDQKRLVSGAEQRLLEDLQWAGLQWDEGPQVGGPHGPYKQSERNEIYQQHAKGLLDSGAAYRCFCTAQTAGQGTTAYVTSGCYQHCASLSSDQSGERAEDGKEPFTIRLKRPEGAQKRLYPDLIYGKITPLKRSPTALTSTETESGTDASDTILLKSDGTPTYHFANVVDDHLMEITHVIRGTEWMASTPLHYDLYHAFGWTPPAFAHVGLLVDENKAKLSKRNADLALDVQSMRNEHGVLPETLVNFLALLGWSNPTDNDVMDMHELIQNFDLKFTKGNTMVKMEKLWYLQKHHVARRCDEARNTQSAKPIDGLVDEIAAEAKEQFREVTERFSTDDQLRQYCSDILLADSKSYQNARQYVNRNRYFFTFDAGEVPLAQEFYDKDKTIAAGAVHSLVKTMLESFDFKQPYRDTMICGTKVKDYYTPSPDEDSKPQIEKDSAKIHAALNNQIWTTVLNNFPPGPSPQSHFDARDGLYLPESHELPFTDQPFDEAAFVDSFDKSPGVAGSDLPNHVAVEAAVRRKKAWSTAIMRFLREKLSYGLPGPSIGVVMAILGYEECCRRLGVTAGEAQGW